MLSKLQTVLFIALSIALVLTTGCTPKQTKLTAADNGAEVTLNKGEQLVITLEGNPTTGYNWEPQDLDSAIFQQVGEPEFKSENAGLLGSGGTLTLTFKTLQVGTATLTLVYHRPWETDVEPINTFAVTVTVK